MEAESRVAVPVTLTEKRKLKNDESIALLLLSSSLRGPRGDELTGG